MKSAPRGVWYCEYCIESNERLEFGEKRRKKKKSMGSKDKDLSETLH